MIVGIAINSIKARTTGKVAETNVNVNSMPSIKSVEKKKIATLGINDVLVMGYEFKTSFEPEIGEILIEGDVLYQTDKADEIAKDWKKEKKLDENIAIDVLNGILRKCLVQSINLTSELRLPPPVMFPVVRKNENKNDGE